MIIIKSKREIELMREPCRVTAELLNDLADFIRPGVSTMDISDYVEKRITSHGMKPTFKGYGGFPAAACVSVNEEVIHGIPHESRKLKEGDIVSIDVGATYKGYNSDAARTYLRCSSTPKASGWESSETTPDTAQAPLSTKIRSSRTTGRPERARG